MKAVTRSANVSVNWPTSDGEQTPAETESNLLYATRPQQTCEAQYLHFWALHRTIQVP
jgi:hypothetical protein